MQQSSTALFNRPDTLLGVCEGLGQDLGFNPFYLRVALSVGLLWSPIAMFSTYAVLGVVVALSRLIFRAPKTGERRVMQLAEVRNDSIIGGNDEHAVSIAAAA